MFQTINNTSLIISLLMLLCAYVYQAYILCYYGDLLIEKSSALADKVYFSNWYTRNAEDMKMTKFVLMRAQKPCCISIFKFSQVSMLTFKTVCGNITCFWLYHSLIIFFFRSSVAPINSSLFFVKQTAIRVQLPTGSCTRTPNSKCG